MQKRSGAAALRNKIKNLNVVLCGNQTDSFQVNLQFILTSFSKRMCVLLSSLSFSKLKMNHYLWLWLLRVYACY